MTSFSATALPHTWRALLAIHDSERRVNRRVWPLAHTYSFLLLLGRDRKAGALLGTLKDDAAQGRKEIKQSEAATVNRPSWRGLEQGCMVAFNRGGAALVWRRRLQDHGM